MEKYITKDEFLKSKGIDLEYELPDDDNPSNKCERFIEETTDWCIDYLVQHYCCAELLNWETLIPERQDRFRKGVMCQISYILRNGLISQDSGYNATTNTIIDFDNIVMDKNAKRQFWYGGFANIPTGVRRF